jgi:hypothetical protein
VLDARLPLQPLPQHLEQRGHVARAAAGLLAVLHEGVVQRGMHGEAAPHHGGQRRHYRLEAHADEQLHGGHRSAIETPFVVDAHHAAAAQGTERLRALGGGGA